MLRLDEDFSEFHRLCAGDPDLRFVAKSRCGGLLRAPSAFEDIVKTVCTTNCDWRNTKKMCLSLCAMAGGSFPTPENVLAFSPRRLAKLAPVGYRASTIVEIAKRSVEGRLPVESWAQEGDFLRVREALGEIRGIGPYSLNHILVLLGAYDTIPVDSEVLAYLRHTHFRGRPVREAEAVQPYHRYGRFRFLAFKFSRMGRKLNYIDK
jgi:3-methyladenine DNA glycosylase/8-oxoguanine DNA glycosylase